MTRFSVIQNTEGWNFITSAFDGNGSYDIYTKGGEVGKFYHPQGNRPMTYDTGEMPDELNEIWRLEDRLNEEGKYTSFLFGSTVSLHGSYTANDLIEILKYLTEKE